MPTRKIQMIFNPEQNAYLSTCARIRGIAVTALMMRLAEVICRDQMVEAILDDKGERARRPSEHAYREQRRPRMEDPEQASE